MKRFLMLLAAGIVASMLAACNGSVPTLTFQQQVAIVCGDANAAVGIAQGAGLFTGGAQDTLNKQIQPDVAKVCAAGATVTKPNLQNLVSATSPVLVTIVANSSMQQADKDKAYAAIGILGAAVNTAIALMPAAVPTAASAPAVVAPAPAASAPVAASQ
jgi:hypothetical protein